MAEKIVLFLSELKPAAVEKEYLCPDSFRVAGTQTNEAPVRYLLHRYPDVVEVICIVTPGAEEKALGHFTAFMRENAPKVAVRRVAYAEGEDFMTGPLSEIMSCLRPGDRILLETTGGFRSEIMLLLLMSRVLSYAGIHTAYAVYSNFHEGRIEDLSHLIYLFDLVGGMQELASFGSARTLRVFYGDEPKDERIGRLLTAVEQLSESITLCRTRQIDARMRALGEALHDAEDCTDPLMRQLLPAFYDKFGKKLTTPGLIRWCEESDMLQQALTVYTERIPAYIMSRSDLLAVSADEHPNKKEYQDEETALFLNGFLLLSLRSTDGTIIPPQQALRNYICANKGPIVYLAQGKKTSVPPSIEKGIRNLALICHLAYPGRDIPFRPDWAAELPASKGFLQELEDSVSKINAVTVYDFLYVVPQLSDHFLSVLLELEDPQPQQQNGFVLTLQHLEDVVAGSNYRINCSIQQMLDISRDYLYIKALRNLANHANDESTESELLDYLEQCGYQPLEQVTTQELHLILKRALQHLLPTSKKERKA